MGERSPTRHERDSGQPWDASYTGAEPAPWDIGVQPAVLGLPFSGSVLDAGCGSGEHALWIAARGLRVVGVDVAPTAISRAREKAAARGLSVDFRVQDALHLERLGERFDTVLDVGLFHAFDAEERRAYVAGLAQVARGTVYVLCFRPAEGAGPHPVSEASLRSAFADGWSVESLAEAAIDTTFAASVPAWLATIRRMVG